MATALDRVDHLVVLMMENGPFDRMVGFLRSSAYPIEGLTGEESLPRDPADPQSPRVPVTTGAVYRGGFDVVPGDDRTSLGPDHDFISVHNQLFRGSTTGEPINEGFIWSYRQQPGNTDENAVDVARCYAPEQLPVLTTLAHEFALCDHWFSSVPGPTWPNRLFTHAATSAGHVDNGYHPEAYEVDTIYDRLAAHGASWKIYFHDIPQALALVHLQHDTLRSRFRHFSDYLEDARNGTLPAYAFIEPRYTGFLHLHPNDQHPPHDVALGEYLIADVYEALRASPLWERSLLVVLADEHGGCYDHLPPPRTVAPDDKVSEHPPFGFDRLGVRVPAVIVSPYVPRGTIDHRTYDHTSIAATLEKRFGMPPLTRRDAAAQTFDVNLSLPEPRPDAPLTLPRPNDPVTAEAYRMSQRPLLVREIAAALKDLHGPRSAKAPVSDLQKSLVELSKELALGSDEVVAKLFAVLHHVDKGATEHDAGEAIWHFSTTFFSRLVP